MPKIAYSQVVDVLLDRFPEFKETDEFQVVRDDLELPYAVWGAFADYVTTYMRRLPADRLDADDLVNRVFDFANELMDMGDDDVQTIVVVELFENFYMYRKTLELGRRKLKPQHVTWLEKQGEWLGTCDLHYEGELLALDGLDELEPLLSRCSWDVRVICLSDDKSPRLESNNQQIDLDMDSGPGPRRTFFGAPSPWCGEPEARRLLGELSRLLAGGNIAHHIRLYRTGRGDELLEEFRHRWSAKGPEETPKPS